MILFPEAATKVAASFLARWVACYQFLCHKCSHPEGGYTEDYKRANNLYIRLKEKGFKVFFAPLEMEKQAAGEDYEAMIYHALKTSRVMLVVCSSPEYLHSKWVKAEWLRFLRMMAEDDRKRLIPLLYGGMDPHQLPKNFQYRRLQGIDMEGDGYELVEQNLRQIFGTTETETELRPEPPPPPPRKPRKSRGWIVLLAVLLVLAAVAGFLVVSGVLDPCEHSSSSWQQKVAYSRNDGTYHTVTEVQREVCDDCGRELQRLEETTHQEMHTYVGGECDRCGTKPTPTPTPTPKPPTPTPTPSPTTPTPSPTPSPTPTPGPTTPTPSPTPSPTPTPTPIVVVSMTMNISYNEDSEIATVSWSAVGGGVKYRVKRANGKDHERGAWKTISELNATRYADDAIQGRIYSSYQVEALDQRGNVIGRSTEKSVYAATWGAPIWTEKEVREDGTTRIVDTRTQYQYQDKIPQYSAWTTGRWVSVKKEITDPDLMKEEQSTKYAWWAAKCKACGRHNPYWGSKTKCHGCGQYLPEGTWSHASYYTDDRSGSVIDGRSNGRVYDGNPYWFTGNTKPAYRYSTRTVTYVWGARSAWQDAFVEETSTRKVYYKTLYCYQKLE